VIGLMEPSDSPSETGALALRRWSTVRPRLHWLGAENDGTRGGQDAVHEARPDDAPGLDVRWIAVEGMQLRSDPEGNV
jgi:hypothetical protein